MDDTLLETLRWAWSKPADRPLARARLLLLDTLGCAVAGAQAAPVRALAAGLPRGGFRLPGLPYGLDRTGYATVFAAAACWHEACEGLAEAHGRPGLHAIPAALAAGSPDERAQDEGAPDEGGPDEGGPDEGLGDWGAAVEATIVGYEIGARMGIAHRIKPGMHVDGTWGTYAAAAAACHRMGLSPEQGLAALNHAACHLPFSLYLPVARGSTARNLYAGHGAAAGLMAAAAARAGLGGPPGAVAEAARVALGQDLPPLDGPGTWWLPRGYLKAHAGVKHVHYGVEAALRWGGDAAALTTIELEIYPEALTYCGNRAPTTQIQAQFSLSWALAHALRHGGLGPEATGEAALADPATRRLEALVVLRAADSPRRACTLRLDGGWSAHVDGVPGDPDRPMDEATVVAKFLAYAGPALGAARARRVAAQVLRAET